MWNDWVGDEWTWFYMGSQNVWLGVIIYLMLTKYGNIKFGGDDAEPEFSKLQWFGMMYTCGVAVGLFFYGVAEPVWHYKATGSGAWALRSADMNDGDRANYALMQTYFHWGIHGWIPYVLIGALLAIMSYRRGLPRTMRTCFYPLWGRVFPVVQAPRPGEAPPRARLQLKPAGFLAYAWRSVRGPYSLGRGFSR